MPPAGPRAAKQTALGVGTGRRGCANLLRLLLSSIPVPVLGGQAFSPPAPLPLTGMVHMNPVQDVQNHVPFYGHLEPLPAPRPFSVSDPSHEPLCERLPARSRRLCFLQSQGAFPSCLKNREESRQTTHKTHEDLIYSPQRHPGGYISSTLSAKFG
jgi:hypothetical protein